MRHRLTVPVLFLLFFIANIVEAQDFSNKGKDFWLAYPGHIDGNSSRMALYISSTVSTTGVVELPGGTTIPFTVTANQATVVQISPAIYNVINPQSEGVFAGRGIHITSLQPIVIYAHILNQARSGSTLVLPTNTLGREYIASSHRSMANANPPNGTANGSNAGSQFTIVGVEDNTTVEITPSVADAGAVRFANTPFTIVLNKGDVYQYRSTYNNDITGTKIRTLSSSTSSCKPIAVFCGSSWTSLDCNNASGGDNLFLQLMPKSAWGKNYVTAPFADRQYDIFRVIVDDPTTAVTRNGSALNQATLVNGTYYQFTSSSANVITSDKPIMVIQYMISQTCDTRNNNNTGANAPYPGDPEMIIINPIEQTLNDVTVVSARANLTPPNTNITKHFFTIIMKTNALSSLRIDGLPANGNVTSIGTSGYSYIHENVTASTAVNPSHRITADSGFIALAYGMGAVESYGYNAGTNIIDLYQYISLQNQYATVNFPATCVGTPFRFSITLPYQAVKIRWDFNNAANLSPNTLVQIDPPVGSSVVPADSSFVRDGKTLYLYKLPVDYIFSTPGTYPIKVLVNNPTPDGCSGDQEINYDVVVYPKPVVDWTITSNGCLTEAAQFNDATNAGGRTVTDWLWEFGDVTTSNVKNPSKTYTNPGTYNVKLTTITDIGCIADNTKPFTITAAPVAAFEVDSPRCEGAVITFTDESTLASGTIAKWYWDFGNGHTIINTTNAAVSQTYPAAGTYNVTLEVESSTGCKSILTSIPVVVSQFPIVDFAIPNVVCLPIGAASFTNQSTIPDGTETQLSYEWTFGDGGTASVKDPTHNYSATGPFDVKLKVISSAGCIKELTKQINTIYARPTANFTIDNEICLRDTIGFASSSVATGQTVTTWNWNFGNGSLSNALDTQYVFTIADTFDVSLFVYSDKGCISDTMTQQVIVNPLPTAAFTVSSPVCETKDISFTSNSQANVGILTNWHWNFGDGNTSDLTNGNPFTHVIASAGSYNVSLAVESNKGCKDTTTQPLVVHHQPVANFILPEVCLNDSYAQFLDSSHIGDNTESSFIYAWTFGDANATAANPNTSTIKDPTHQYTALGDYTAQVKVTSINGCVDSIARTFTVNGSFPVADFDVLNSASLCSNREVVIQNKSSVMPGNITKVEIYWDYLNNPTIKETDEVPFFDKTYSHLYPDFQQPLTRTFQVRFVAYSGGSCTGEFIQDITVNASPKTLFITIPGICLDAAPRQITQASEVGGVPKAQDVFSSTTSAISSAGLFDPSVAGAGTYTIQYLYISPEGCRDSSTETITVWPSPIAKFGLSNPICEKAPLTFTDSSDANIGSITTWNWNFGDGNIIPRNTAAAFTHTYNLPNTYIVSLSVTTDSGCTSMPQTQNLQVNHLPVVNFDIPSICLPDGRGTFTDLSTIADGTAALFSYLWDFGDPADSNPSTQKDPMHRYSGVGPYDVKLKVTSSEGCIDSLTQTIGTIYPQPKANFNINPNEVCLGESFNFTDLSQPTGSNAEIIVDWHWDFGDGSSLSLIKDPLHTYADDSTYAVSLYVFNNRGCVSDTMVKNVTVHPFPVVNAGPDAFVLSDGFIILNPIVSGSNLTYQWTPGQYLDNAAIKNPKFTPGVDQMYRLTVTGIGGCTSFDDVFVKVLKSPVIPNAFSPNKDGINDTWNILYLDSYPGCTVEVFDRYGRRMFFSQGYDNPWNGTLNGKELSVGVYYYIINPKNGRKPMSGSITILK